MITQQQVDEIVEKFVPKDFQPIGGFDAKKVRAPQVTNFSVLGIDDFLKRYLQYRPNATFIQGDNLVMPRGMTLNWGLLKKMARVDSWKQHVHSHSVWLCETIESYDQLLWIILHEVGHVHFNNNRPLLQAQGWKGDIEELYADTYAFNTIEKHFDTERAKEMSEKHGALGGMGETLQ